MKCKYIYRGRAIIKVALPIFIIALVVVSTATAGWLTSGGGGGNAKALSMSQGPQPTTSTVVAPVQNVTVSWNAVTLGGTTIDGYNIARYNTDTSAVVAIGSACSGLIASVSCIENSVSAGRWQYTIIPKESNWLGTESTKSAVLTIVAPPTSTAVSNGGGVNSVYVNITNRASVSVRVTLPATSRSTDTVHVKITNGANNISGTIAALTGAGNVTVTGLNTTALGDGSLTITAWSTANSGEASSNATAGAPKDTVQPTASNIQTTNFGTVGQPEAGDKMIYTFSEAPNPASILAGWTGTSTAVTAKIAYSTKIFTTLNSAGTATLPLGNVSLTNQYTSADTTFTGSTMILSGSTLTVTLGTPSRATVKATATATMGWTPVTTATDSAGNAMTTTKVNESGTADTDF